jgi:hypothetical protein
MEKENFSYLEVFNLLTTSWKPILLSGLVCGMLSVILLLNSPKVFKSEVILQMARVASIDAETTTTLLEKLKIATYFSTKTHAACKVDRIDDPGSAIVSKLKVRLPKTPNLIHLTYYSESKDLTIMCLESLISDIKNDQNNIVEPLLKFKQSQIISLKNDIALLDKYSNNILRKDIPYDLINKDENYSFILFNLFYNHQLRNDLKKQLTELENALSPPNTIENHAIIPIFSSKNPIESNKIIAVIASVFFGFLLVIGFLLAKRKWPALKTIYK